MTLVHWRRNVSFFRGNFTRYAETASIDKNIVLASKDRLSFQMPASCHNIIIYITI